MIPQTSPIGESLRYRLTSWSVRQLIRLNSRMTSSPPFVSVGFLITNPSGHLFHSLSNVIVSSVIVRGWWPICTVSAFSRSCTEKLLKIVGNSASSSFHMVFRVFSPLIQMNHQLVDVRRTNSSWMILNTKTESIHENSVLSRLYCPTVNLFLEK